MKSKQKIKREFPQIGTKLVGKFKTKSYAAKIIRDDKDSKGRLIEFNDKKYTSMSAAARVITKNPVNGWRFWKIVQ